jgi:hypothetical protein
MTKGEEVILSGGMLALTADAIGKRAPIEILLVIPIVVLYLILPPQEYAPRYLIPALPPLIAVLVRTFRPLTARTRPAAAFYLSALLVTYFLYLPQFLNQRYDYDTLLLKDLATQLNPVVTSDDKILIYEIQAQYYLEAPTYSLDAVVGNQLFGPLTGKESFENYIRREHINYIVTADSFNYRTIYRNTLLERLYLHDLSNPLGSSIEIGGLVFTKILTNPVFDRAELHQVMRLPSLNTGSSLRVYGDWNPRWSGHYPMWNSVYQITLK